MLDVKNQVFVASSVEPTITNRRHFSFIFGDGCEGKKSPQSFYVLHSCSYEYEITCPHTHTLTGCWLTAMQCVTEETVKPNICFH